MLKLHSYLIASVLIISSIEKSFSFHHHAVLHKQTKTSTHKLQQHQLHMQRGNDRVETVDVAVIGSGIAGSTISWLLQEQQGLKVALIDPRVNGEGISQAMKIHPLN